MSRTRFTNLCVECGHHISVPYSLPIDEHGPLCDDCEKQKPPPTEPPPPAPLGGLPF